MSRESLTVRGDGVVVAEIHIWSRAEKCGDETWTPGERREVRREHKGERWTETITLKQRLRELALSYCGQAEKIYAAVEGCAVVTIRDENRY